MKLQQYAYFHHFCFILLAALVIIQRFVSLHYFGFRYTDIDQLILWNGATDYAQGIFHEPYFYGQPYNYMFESLVAAPLLLLDIPIHIALPAATSFLSLFPFFVLAMLFFHHQQYFWSYLLLGILLFLPVEYSFITSISRGNVQAMLFIPLLFFSILSPRNSRYIPLLMIGTGLCYLANPSSMILAIPALLYVGSFHWKSGRFYLNSLWILPSILLEIGSKSYYTSHPHKVLHTLEGLEPNWNFFEVSIANSVHFEYLFPFATNAGAIYFLVLLILVVVAWKKSMKRESIFILSLLLLLIALLSVNKIQWIYENTGLFYSRSRFYLALPLVIILCFYLVFQKTTIKPTFPFIVVIIALLSFFGKSFYVKKKAETIASSTIFPVEKTEELEKRYAILNALCTKNEIQLIVNHNHHDWRYGFDSYAFYPIHSQKNPKNPIQSINLSNDRRTWVYPPLDHSPKILLNGFNHLDSIPAEVDFSVLSHHHSVVHLQKLTLPQFFEKWNIHFGN